MSSMDGLTVVDAGSIVDTHQCICELDANYLGGLLLRMTQSCFKDLVDAEFYSMNSFTHAQTVPFMK